MLCIIYIYLLEGKIGTTKEAICTLTYTTLHKTGSMKSQSSRGRVYKYEFCLSNTVHLLHHASNLDSRIRYHRRRHHRQTCFLFYLEVNRIHYQGRSCLQGWVVESWVRGTRLLRSMIQLNEGVGTLELEE